MSDKHLLAAKLIQLMSVNDPYDVKEQLNDLSGRLFYIVSVVEPYAVTDMDFTKMSALSNIINNPLVVIDYLLSILEQIDARERE